MKKTAVLFRRNERRSTAVEDRPERSSIPLSRIRTRLADWLIECDGHGNSSNTNDLRRNVVNNLAWFLQSREYAYCGERELREFLHYVRHGHEIDGCRWGNPQANKPVRPSTVKTYHAHLCVFFKWLARKKDIDASPMATIDPPKVPRDQVQPFTEDHIGALMSAVKHGAYPRRDMAILLLLLDTGIRESELCGIKQSDVDIDHRRVTVVGKGNKRRTVVFGVKTARAINEYMARELAIDDDKSRSADLPLFISDRGKLAGGGLTASGLLQMFGRWNERAKLQNVRCSPHTCRHTFAVNFLRAGGQLLVLQQMLGHEDVKQCAKYVKMAQADIDKLARPFSPMDRMKRG